MKSNEADKKERTAARCLRYMRRLVRWWARLRCRHGWTTLSETYIGRRKLCFDNPKSPEVDLIRKNQQCEKCGKERNWKWLR